MIVTKSSKYSGFQGRALRSKIEKRLEKKALRGMVLRVPTVALITETIQHVNAALEKSRYFYSDIKKEGVLLYDSGELTLAEPRELGWEERKEMAKEDFEQWYPYGKGFLRDSGNTIKYGELKLGAFYLHQAPESFYNAILLVFSNYKCKIHDIETLGTV